MAHTKEPWTHDYSPSTGFGCGYGRSQIIDSVGRPLAGVAAIAPDKGPMYEQGGLSRATLDTVEANAHRIVAAVNACEGISTEALEGGVVKELLAICKAIDDGPSIPYQKLYELIAKVEGEDHATEEG